jgi:hypothetical protein
MRPAAVHAGGADRDRTDGLLNANQALSQLSYSPRTPFAGSLNRWGFHPSRQPGSRELTRRGQLDVSAAGLSQAA